MSNKNDYNTAFFIHLSAFFGFVFPFGGVVAPLVIWELKKRESDFLDQSGKEAVNFNLSFFLYSFVLGLSAIPFAFRSFFMDFYHFDFFGIASMVSLIGVLWIVRVILIISVATKANRGELYRYPLTIKFIK